MKRASLVVAVAVLTLAIGCRSENSVTGTPSVNRTLAGKVIPVGDLAGSTPSGINVSSNGQIAVTDAAGNFAFVTLPAENVQLNFSRADGISARATVSATASAVVVELQKTQAAVVTSGTGGQVKELEGLIVAVSDASITVANSSTHRDETAAITASTVIRKGNRQLTPADLEKGDRVHVKTSGPADALVAIEIMLQNEADGGDGGGDNGGQVKELEGLIVTVSDTSITVANASTHRDETAAITADTIIRKGNQRLKPSDLHQGDRVHVKTTGPADALVALEIKLQNPN